MQIGVGRASLKTALSENAAEKGIEVFIVNKHGEILYPFKSIGQVQFLRFRSSTIIILLHTWNEKQSI
jgi:diguanylate cyclase